MILKNNRGTLNNIPSVKNFSILQGDQGQSISKFRMSRNSSRGKRRKMKAEVNFELKEGSREKDNFKSGYQFMESIPSIEDTEPVG